MKSTETTCLLCGCPMPMKEALVFERHHKDTCFVYEFELRGGEGWPLYDPWTEWYECWDIRTYLHHKGLGPKVK